MMHITQLKTVTHDTHCITLHKTSDTRPHWWKDRTRYHTTIGKLHQRHYNKPSSLHRINQTALQHHIRPTPTPPSHNPHYHKINIPNPHYTILYPNSRYHANTPHTALYQQKNTPTSYLPDHCDIITKPTPPPSSWHPYSRLRSTAHSPPLHHYFKLEHHIIPCHCTHNT